MRCHSAWIRSRAFRFELIEKGAWKSPLPVGSRSAAGMRDWRIGWPSPGRRRRSCRWSFRSGRGSALRWPAGRSGEPAPGAGAGSEGVAHPQEDLFQVDGLGQEFIRPGGNAAQAVAVLAEGSDQQHGDVPGGRVGLDLRHTLKPFMPGINTSRRITSGSNLAVTALRPARRFRLRYGVPVDDEQVARAACGCALLVHPREAGRRGILSVCHRFLSGPGGPSGSETIKRLPLPGPSLSAQALPPCSSTMRLTSDRPRPVRAFCRLRWVWPGKRLRRHAFQFLQRQADAGIRHADL